jgi:AraC-like DNA-binding protein
VHCNKNQLDKNGIKEQNNRNKEPDLSFKDAYMSLTDNSAIKKEYAAGLPGHVKNARYFYFDNLDTAREELSILCGGHEQCASDFDISRDNFPFFAAIFIVSGRGSVTIGGTKQPISFGTLVTFAPHTPYRLTASSDEPMEQFFVLFSDKRPAGILHMAGLSETHAVPVSRPETAMNNFKQILDLGINQPPYAHTICRHYLSATLLEQNHCRQDITYDTTSCETFKICREYLENNFIRINSSLQLAEECGFNIRYIARLFRRHLGIRPYEHLMNLKMNKAANLLLTTSFNINQIAGMTGIEDPYHFSRIFKKKFKKPPSEYRKHIT